MSDGREMTVTGLGEALAVKRLPETGAFAADVPDGWQQGRGAYGGLVLGLLARAMEDAQAEPERPLRTLSGEILEPVVPGRADLAVEALRVGKGLSSWAARLTQGGALRAHATAIFGRARLSDREHLGLRPPASLRWEDVEVAPVEPPLAPEFARGFEYRPTGTLPFSGSSVLEAEGFIRPRNPPARLGAPELVALIDAWWPTALANEEGPRPMATVSFNFQLFVDPASVPADVPLRYRATAPGAHDGYLSEVRELWTLDGRLCALNPQTFVYIK